MIVPAAMDVCANCAYTSLPAAVAAAKPGSVIRVHDRQPGGTVVRVPLTIEGAGGEISGGTSGIGIDVRAPRVTIRHLTLRGFGRNDSSGRSAAIVVESDGDSLVDITFFDNTFGLSAFHASHLLVSGARFASNDPAGDPIRVWRSTDVTIAGSVVDGGRDVFVDWSPNVVVRDTVFSHLRYGLHDMFSPNMLVERNVFSDCEIGSNFMYAQHLRVIGNRFANNSGPTGYGVGLEDTDDGVFTGNIFTANHVGMHVIDSPADPAEGLSIERNLFAANSSGLSVQSDARSITVLSNAFVENTEQVQVSGGASTPGITWSNPAGGNFWSDYAGFARDGSAIGALPYRPSSTFESVLDANPDLQIFRRSAAADAIDFATRTLAAQPAPKLIDTAPLMRAPVAAAASGVPDANRRNTMKSEITLASVLGIPLVSLFASAAYPLSTRRRVRKMSGIRVGPAVELEHVTKEYAGKRGVRDVSLTIDDGESVALWGPNGAGKTTLLRSILGQTTIDGRIAVYGFDRVDTNDRARRLIGYAPQYMPDFEMPISSVVRMVAHLRGADTDEVKALFAEFGLDDQDARHVSELSGGLRQRLSVACALIGDPPLLILDEPTAGLDRASRHEVLEILRALRAKGKTLLFTSHLLADVQALADRVVLMEDGRVVDDVTATRFSVIAS